MNTIMMLVTVVTLVFFLRFLARPVKELNLYIITRSIVHPFIFLHYTFLGISYSWIWALFLPATYALNFFRREWKILCPLSLPLLLLMLMSLVSMTYTINFRATLEGIIKMMTIFFTYGIAYNAVKSPEDVRKIAKMLALAAVIPLLFGFYQVTVGNYDQIAANTVKRVNSVFGVGNGYGIFLSVVMSATLIVILTSEKKKERLFYILIFGGMIASQILALNRGTWIAFSAGSLLAIMIYRRHLNMKLVMTVLMLVAVMASGVVYKRFTEVRYRYDGRVADTFQGRIETWESLAPVIMRRPLWGYGANASESIIINGHPLAPHNDYVRLSLDYGVLGGLMHFLFLVSLFFFSLKRRRDGERYWKYNFPLLILASYMMVISATQNIVYNLTNYVYFTALAGCVVKLNRLSPSAFSADRTNQE